MGDKPGRAGPFEDFRGDGGIMPTMAPLWASFKLAPDIYDGNTDPDVLVYFEQLALFRMWNEPIKAMILGLAVTLR